MSSELKENQNVAEAADEKVEVNTASVDTEEFAVEDTAAEPVDNRAFELRVSEEQLARKKKFLKVWDKITTGILIFLMASPFAILLYIFLWFIFR